MPDITQQSKRNSVGFADIGAKGVVENNSNAEAAALLARCESGDMQAWNTLIKQNEQSVYRFAYALCRNHDDAADITSQVFLRLYQKLYTFRREASFSSWIFRIVRNSYMDICVRPPCRRNVSLDSDYSGDGSEWGLHELVDPGPTPEAVCLERQTSRMLSRAVKHLPAYQRDVLRMYHSEGKSYEQIAEATGLSIGTVRSRLNRARNMLRERLMPLHDVLTTS